jgi:hypothetical protein
MAKAPKGLGPGFGKQVIDFLKRLFDTLDKANILGRRVCPFESIPKAV